MIRTWPLFIASALATIALGCSGSDERSAPISSWSAAGSTNSTGGSAAAHGGSAGTSGNNAAGQGGNAGWPTAEFPGEEPSDLGSLPIVDIPSTDCTQESATTKAPIDTGSELFAFNQAGVLGGSRFAVDTNSLALVLFDPANLTPQRTLRGPFLAAPVNESVLAALTSDGRKLRLSFSNESAAEAQPSIELADEPTGTHVLAAGSSGILVLFRSGSELKGSIFTSDGKAGPSVSLGAEACGASNCRARAVATDNGFAVVWSRVLQDKSTKTTFVHIGSDGQWSFPQSLIVSESFHRVVALTRTKTGYGLLVGAGYPTEAPVLLFLDEHGSREGSAQRLLGATAAWGLAAQADSVAIVGALQDGRAAIRSLNLQAAPLEDWVCLDDIAPDSGVASQATVFAENPGYGVVVRMSDGSANYLLHQPGAPQ